MIDNNILKLTMNETIPIGIFLEQIKPKIRSRHIYSYLESLQAGFSQKIRFITNSKNERFKKYDFR